MPWAWNNGGIVSAIDTHDPKGRYHNDLKWIPCDASVRLGDIIHDDGSITSAPVNRPTLESRKADLAALRYIKQNLGITFEAESAQTPSRVASDTDSISLVTASYLAAENGLWSNGTPWKMQDGSFVPFTANDVVNLAKKQLAYRAECFAREAALSDALIDDLDVDISIGWPEP